MLVRTAALPCRLSQSLNIVLQETYKAYRDPDTGKPAPIPMIISDLSMSIVAGGFAAIAQAREIADPIQA